MGILSNLFGKKQSNGKEQTTSVPSIPANKEPSSKASFHLRGKPDERGLYPSELVLLTVAPKYKTTETDFPAYLADNYEIINPSKMLVSLQSRGYLTIGKPSDSLSGLTLPELKEIASSIGITVKGKKSDIISQLIELGEEQLAPYIHDRHWVITESGALAIKANPYIQYFLEKHSYNVSQIGIDIWTVNEVFAKIQNSHTEISYSTR